MIYLLGSGKHFGVVENSLKRLKIKFKNISKSNKNLSDEDIEKKIRKLKDKIYLHVSIGDNKIRKKVFNFFKEKNYKFKSIIDPTSIISKNSNIKKGVYVGPGVIINNNTCINENSIINTGSIIEHDTKIGSNSHIAPGAKILGSVSIGENCFIGSGTVVNNNLIITKNCSVGSGSVVVKNIKIKGTYIGIPAKKL